MIDNERLNRRIQREKIARKQAEDLLTEKSRELFNKNQELAAIKDSLEDTVSERTKALKDKVHELTLLQEELRQAKDNAIEASKLKTRFVATISHEIRTPLNGIIGSLDILSEEDLDAKAGSLVSMARSSGDTLNHILNDVLDFSKFEDPNFRLENIVFSLPELIANIQFFWMPQCQTNNIQLDVKINVDDNLFVKGDPERIKQIMNNYISNAIKYSESDRILISAEISQNSSDAGKLTLSVTDYGKGISEKDTAVIFDAFTQASDNFSGDKKGSGLGLTICRQLAKLMDGDTGVKSVLQKGSEFWLTIPIDVISGGENTVNQEIKCVGDVKDILDRPLEVMVVEDVKSNQILVKMMLEKLGANVYIAETGTEAILLSENHTIDVFLMDIGLPDMDGIQVTAKIKNDPNNQNNRSKFVAFTAHGMATEIEKFTELGMDGIITKPVKKDELQTGLLSVINKT